MGRRGIAGVAARPQKLAVRALPAAKCGCRVAGRDPARRRPRLLGLGAASPGAELEQHRHADAGPRADPHRSLRHRAPPYLHRPARGDPRYRAGAGPMARPAGFRPLRRRVPAQDRRRRAAHARGFSRAIRALLRRGAGADSVDLLSRNRNQEDAMNKKFVISAIVVFVLGMGLGFFVHGVLLYGDYAKLPNVMRPPTEAQAKMALMVLAYISWALAFTWIYLKGKEDRPWLAQGARYGLAIAFLTAVPTYLIYHVVSQFPLDLTIKQIVLDTITIVLLGIVLAWINR